VTQHQQQQPEVFSLRKHLQQCGVTDEADMRKHLDFIRDTLIRNPSLDLRRYRPGPSGSIDMG